MKTLTLIVLAGLAWKPGVIISSQIIPSGFTLSSGTICIEYYIGPSDSIPFCTEPGVM